MTPQLFSRFGRRQLAGASALFYAFAMVVCSPTVRAAEPAVHDGESPPASAWRKAMEHGDLAALAQMHDAATVAYPPGSMQVKGAPAIMAGYADLFAHFTVGVKIEDAHWVEVPPLVVSWGLTTLTLHPKDGGADIVSHTRFTDAAVAVGGHWRYLVDHASKPTK